MGRRGKYITLTATALEALDNGRSEVEQLTEEMTEWRENLESNDMSHLPKYDEVSETAETLEISGLDEAARELETALEAAARGKPGKPGCPPHVAGRPCKRCRWSGKIKPPAKAPRLTIYKDPYYDAFGNQVVALLRHPWGSDALYHAGEYGSVSAAQRAAEADYERELREALRDGGEIPQRIPDEPAVPPHPELGALAEHQVKWSEFRKYGKRAMNLSRADRLSNAVSAMHAAVEYLTEELSALLETDPDDERVQEALEATEQVASAVEEVEGVDFPGMFG
jgi:hypothetical protein